MESTETMEPTMKTPESAGMHASPATSAVCSRRPAAESARVRMEATEGGRFSSPVIVVRPGVCIREVVQVGPVEFAAIEFAPVKVAPIQVACSIRMVSTVVVIGMDSANITSMPGRVSYKRGAVEIYGPSGPITSPRVPPPAAAGQGTQSDSGTK